MKADIHPKYYAVVFQDLSSDLSFLTRSTLTSKETIKWEDGETYPLVKVEVSSRSHPFYTGKHKIVDTGGVLLCDNRRIADSGLPCAPSAGIAPAAERTGRCRRSAAFRITCSWEIPRG